MPRGRQHLDGADTVLPAAFVQQFPKHGLRGDRAGARRALVPTLDPTVLGAAVGSPVERPAGQQSGSTSTEAARLLLCRPPHGACPNSGRPWSPQGNVLTHWCLQSGAIRGSEPWAWALSPPAPPGPSLPSAPCPRNALHTTTKESKGQVPRRAPRSDPQERHGGRVLTLAPWTQ